MLVNPAKGSAESLQFGGVSSRLKWSKDAHVFLNVSKEAEGENGMVKGELATIVSRTLCHTWRGTIAVPPFYFRFWEPRRFVSVGYAGITAPGDGNLSSRRAEGGKKLKVR